MPSFAYVWNEYTSYLKRPTPEISFWDDETTPAKRFFVSLLLAFMLVIPVLVIFGILEKAGLLPPSEEHAIKKAMDTFPLPLLFLGAAIAGPIIEEFAFRLALVPKKVYVLVSAWLIASYYVGYLFQNDNLLIAYIVLGILALGTGLAIALPDYWNYRFQVLYSLNYSWVFFGLTSLFALTHLFNYGLSLHVILLAPILVMPQFILGTLLGYLRMRQGMAWAIALHITYNSIVLAAAYYAMQNEPTNGQIL
jgi:membrane protease YdiL (CAAX protease family)